MCSCDQVTMIIDECNIRYVTERTRIDDLSCGNTRDPGRHKIADVLSLKSDCPKVTKLIIVDKDIREPMKFGSNSVSSRRNRKM